MKKNRIAIIYLMFLLFLVLFAVLCCTSGDNATDYSWLLLEAWVFILDIIILIKLRLPSIKSILISIGLALLVAITYLDSIYLAGNLKGLFTLITAPLLIFSSGIAIFTVFEHYPKQKINLISLQKPNAPYISLLIGVLVGIIWGILNYYLSKGSIKSNLNITVHCLLISFSPAIFEEVALRTVFYAFCLFLLQGKLENKFQKFTSWIMMILPHVLVHTPSSFIQGGVINGIVTTILYVVIFGLIFALLQQKRDLTSAMLAHGVVDCIRFCFYGLPF